jgi:hypothetical protein
MATSSTAHPLSDRIQMQRALECARVEAVPCWKLRGYLSMRARVPNGRPKDGTGISSRQKSLFKTAARLVTYKEISSESSDFTMSSVQQYEGECCSFEVYIILHSTSISLSSNRSPGYSAEPPLKEQISILPEHALPPAIKEPMHAIHLRKFLRNL